MGNGFVGREQGTGKKIYRGAIGFWGWWLFGDLATQNALPGFFFCGGEWLTRCEQGTSQKSYRGALGFWGWWPFRSPGYTERASRLLFCGEGWFARHEQGTGKKSYRGAIGFWGWWPFRRPSYAERASRLLFCGEGWLVAWAGRRQKILPRRTRIPLQAASSGAWLHRTRAPATFQWWGVLYRASAAHGHKNPSEKQGTGKKSYRGVIGFWVSGSSGGWPSATQSKQ